LKLENLSRRVTKSEIEKMQQVEQVKRWLRKVESPKTKSEYTKHLIRYCMATEKNPDELIRLKRESRDHDAEDLLDEFVDEAQKIEYSNSMTCVIVAAIKSFYKWNYADLSRGAGKISKLKVKPYRTPDRESLRKFLEGSHIRDKALISFMACTGIAEGSIRELRWKHIQEIDKDVPHIALTSTEIKGGGKGAYQGIEQHTFLTPFAKATLLNYKTWRERKEKRKLNPEDYLFSRIVKPYKNLSNSNLRALFIRRSENSGIEFSPHDLRRFVQTQLETARLQPNWIKKILRHKVAGEENPYSRPKITALREAYRTALPYLDLGEKPKTIVAKEDLRKEIVKTLLDSGDEGILKSIANKHNISVELLKKNLMQMKRKADKVSPLIDIKKSEARKKQDCEKIVDEAELEQWLTKGFKFVAVLPSGKVVITND